MTYTPETQSMLAELMSGNCCDVCGAPNSEPHYDRCPKHPWNTPENLLARIHSMELVLDGLHGERSRLHEERDAARQEVRRLGYLLADARRLLADARRERNA